MKTKTKQSSMLPNRKVLISFFAFIIFTGGAPVAIRIGYSEMAPFWMGLVRFGLGAIIFWMLVFFRKQNVPKGRALLGPVFYGVLGLGISFALMSWGLLKTSASISSIIQAMVPLMSVLLSAVQGIEPLTIRGILGSLLAVIGTVIIVCGSPSMGISLPHIAALILGTSFMAQSGIVLKRFPTNPPIVTNAVAISIATIILAIASLMTGEPWVIPTLPSTWIALSYLIIFVTIFAFLLYLKVLNNWTASGTSYGFVITPLVTFVIAAVFTEEQITLNFLIGAFLILGGVLVGVLSPQKKKTDAG